MRLTSLEKDLSGLVSSLETSFRTSQRRIPTSRLVSSLEIQLTCLVIFFQTDSGLFVCKFRTGSGLKLDRFSDLNLCFSENHSGLVFRGFRTKV